MKDGRIKYGTDVPEFTTLSTNGVEPIYHAGDGEYVVCVRGATYDECSAYQNLLAQSGFQLYAAHEISAGTGRDEKNRFYTYTGKGLQIFLSWCPYSVDGSGKDKPISVCRVIVTQQKPLPPVALPKAESGGNRIIPTLAQLGVSVIGMCYVVQLEDGTFVVVDGGIYNEYNVELLYQYLLEYTPEGSVPTIAMWLFTHPHADHIEAAKKFIKRYSTEVTVRAFAYNFVANDFTTTGRGNWKENDEETVLDFRALENIIEQQYPNALVYTVHTGQVYRFRGMELEILHTEEDFYPTPMWTWNELSVNFRMIFGNGKKVLFLGDNMQSNCRMMEAAYGDYLKSDMLQVAHHGHIGGLVSLYELVDPDVCFWSCPEESFHDEHRTGVKKGCESNGYLRDTAVKERIHYHNGSTAIVSFF